MNFLSLKHLFAYAVIAQMLFFISRLDNQQINESEIKNSSLKNPGQEIKIVVASQESEGLTQNEFSMEFLKNLEKYIVSNVKLKAKEILRSQGMSGAKVDISSESTYVENSGVKLAVIRLRSFAGSYETNEVFISGIVNNEFKRIACVRNSKTTIPIFYGDCSEKIKEVFGIEWN